MLHRWSYCLCLLALVPACSNSPDAPGLDASADAPTSGDASVDAPNTNDATTPPDASAPVSFTVPANGGSVDVTGSQPYTIEFPADVGGQTFTIELISAASVGLKPARFRDVFRFGPNGTQFTTPVKLVPKGTDPVPFAAMVYAEPVVPSNAEFVVAANGAYPLTHFSLAGVFNPSPKAVCDSTPGHALALPDYCMPASYTPTTGFVFGPVDSVPGNQSVGTDCIILDACADITTAACVSSTLAGDISNSLVWGGAGGPPYGYGAITNACGGTPSTGCSPGTGGILATGCGFRSTCSNGSESLSCDGTTCGCGGSKSGTTFLQGATCASPKSGQDALFANCH